MAADPLPLSCDDKDLRETVSKSSTSEERPSSLIASRMKLKVSLNVVAIFIGIYYEKHIWLLTNHVVEFLDHQSNNPCPF